MSKPSSSISLPANWPTFARKALLHAASMAHLMLAHTQSWAADSPIERVRLKSRLDDAERETSLLREQIRLLRGRLADLRMIGNSCYIHASAY